MANRGQTGSGAQGGKCRLVFHGDDTKFELWEVKFLGYLRSLKLHEVITADPPDAEKNADVFSELVQLLDDTSLSLIIRDAKDDGKKALKILRDHYIGASKPRIISLYTELTSLKMINTEGATEYMIRAETASASLKSAGETISDSLLIAMIIKGLPEDYKTFCTVVTQRKEPMSFSEFKIALRSCEETEKCQVLNKNKDDDSVMFIKQGQDEKKYVLKCYDCKQVGHKASECRNKKNKSRYKSKRWCEHCKSSTHDTSYCRYRNKENKVNSVSEISNQDDNDHSFVMKVRTVSSSLSGHTTENQRCITVCPFEQNNLLVDSGSSTHIVTDKSKFLKFDAQFEKVKHTLELADGSRQNGVAEGRGNANIKLCDSSGNVHSILLENALYIPSYKSDIFSVRAATNKGASVEFTPKYSKLTTSDGTIFKLQDKEKLFFLQGVTSGVPSYAVHHCNKVTTGNKKKNSQTLQQWHDILGHCNSPDILKLEKVVNDMIITDKSDFDCETCILGKMTQYVNRTPDAKSERSLEFIHCDIAGPVTPVAREGFKYAINFIDDYSGATFVYFLKKKSDALKALEKFLADSAPYGEIKRFRRDNALEFISVDFEKVLIRNKIKSELSCYYSAHQNGTSERAWRTLFEMGRCILIQSGLPKNLWPYAVKAAAYIRNRCYNPRLEITPYEALTKKVPSLSNMHTFGSECFAYVQKKTKLDPRCEKGIFVGYDSYSPAYLVYFADEGTIKKVRCVTFNEKCTEKVEVREVKVEK